MGTITANQTLITGVGQYSCLVFIAKIKRFDVVAYYNPDTIGGFYCTSDFASSPAFPADVRDKTMRLWEIYFAYQHATNPNPPEPLEVRFKNGEVVESEITGLEKNATALAALALLEQEYPSGKSSIALVPTK